MGRGNTVNAQALTPRTRKPRFTLEKLPTPIADVERIVGSEEHRRLVELAIRSRTRTFERLEFSPGQGSWTNMHGRIYVDSAVPEDGSAEERAICINGLARHELLHVLHTDKAVFDAFFRDLEQVREREGDQAALQIKHLWNSLEDGMIETRELRREPGSYRWIAGLNELWPRVGRDYTLDEERQLPWAADYTPTDAQGNELPVADGVVTIPAGTTLSAWGAAPLSLHEQAASAVLAEAVPGFAPGELHPRVQACFDEMQPYIDAARDGNSADCVRCAYSLYELLRTHDLLPPVVETEHGGSQVAGPGGTPSGASQPVSAPEGFEFVPGDGQGAAPQNPMPSVPGQPQPGEDLSKILGAGGSGDQADDEKTDGDEKGVAGEQGEDGEKSKQDDGAPSSSSGGEGGEQEAGGVRGADSDLKRLRDQVRDELTREASRQAGRSERTRWKAPGGQQIVPQRELTEKAQPWPADAEMKQLGARLGAQLEQLISEAANDQRYLRVGTLDRKRLPAVVAGSTHVAKRRSVPARTDTHLEVVIDRSGSTLSDTEDQLRMAKMFAHCGERVPGLKVGIWGFDGGRQRSAHYQFKQADSPDLRGVDALPACGGGGTPTADAVEFARARLEASEARHRLLVVITDGEAADIPATREEIDLCERAGIRTLGLGFDCDGEVMKEQFGSRFELIDDYRQAPRLVGRLILGLFRSSLRR
jgi:hypothetical protein